MASQKLLLLLLTTIVTFLPNETSALCTATIETNHLASSCAFNPLLLVMPPSGWVLSKLNCGEVIDLEPFVVPPVLYFDHANENRLYTLLFLEFGHHGRHYLRWHIVNLSGTLLLEGVTYMDGDTALDYLPPVPRSSSTDDAAVDDDADDDDVDGQPTRYGFYLYEQVYGAIYPPARAGSSDDSIFDLDAWIGAIYPEGALCGPVASIGFSARASQPVTAS